jgi:hypothetical protein
MLKRQKFQLFSETSDNSLIGVIRSQTNPDLVYSCRLTRDGNFGCCTQNLRACGGLRGAICKHLLVLIVGLIRAEKLNPTDVDSWIFASFRKKPTLDRDLMGQAFLKFTGAITGEIDWRPTETTPEDFYAF